MTSMKEQNGHYHARSRYKETGLRDYINLIQDIVTVRQSSGISLNVHLPYEIQHPDIYQDFEQGLQFIRFGEGLKKFCNIPVYWENSPELWYGSWNLKHNQVEWGMIPQTIELTLDTGHLILGAASAEEARNRIEETVSQFGDQIRHLHIHENDLIHDWHWPIGFTITEELLSTLAIGRSYIFEEDQNITGASPQPPYEPLYQYYPHLKK